MKKSHPGSRQNRVARILTTLPVASRLCGACAFWGGSRNTTRHGFIEIPPYSKGECRRDGFKHLEMAALATCDGWESWPALSGEKCGHERQGVG